MKFLQHQFGNGALSGIATTLTFRAMRQLLLKVRTTAGCGSRVTVSRETAINFRSPRLHLLQITLFLTLSGADCHRGLWRMWSWFTAEGAEEEEKRKVETWRLFEACRILESLR